MLPPYLKKILAVFICTLPATFLFAQTPNRQNKNFPRQGNVNNRQGNNQAVADLKKATEKFWEVYSAYQLQQLCRHVCSMAQSKSGGQG